MTMNYDMYNFIRTATADTLADIALKMIAEHPATFEKLAVEFLPQYVTIIDPINQKTWKFTPDQIRKFKTLVDKISRIKELRMITSFGLKEAKDMVESQSFQDATK